MEPAGRRRKRRRTILSRLRGLRPAQVVAALVAIGGMAGAAAALVLALNRHVAPPPNLVQSPPLRSTPRAGATSAAAPGTPDTVRLVIPGGGIDLQVREGDGLHVPLNLAMHYPGTSEPGGGGNSLFYAHAQPGMFLGLYSLHVGDEVRVYRSDGSQLIYQVRTLHKVPYNDDQVVRQTPFEEITLLTCTSYNPYNPRYIVTATPLA